jgi:hypothetical protein
MLTVVFRNFANAPKNGMGQAWHDWQRRKMRTRVSAWGDTEANVGDNINMVIIKVTGYCCVNTVLQVHGHIKENVAGASQKFRSEEFQNENKYHNYLRNYTESITPLSKLK